MVIPRSKSRKLTKRDTPILVVLVCLGLLIVVASFWQESVVDKVAIVITGAVFFLGGLKELKRLFFDNN